MTRVLVYFHEKYMAPSGGPAGYLYNLKRYLEDAGCEKSGAAAGETNGVADGAAAGAKNSAAEPEIVFLNDKDFHSRFSFLAKKAAQRVFSADRSLSETGKRIEQILFNSEQDGRYALDGFDAVHFHSTADMFAQKKTLENFKGKVILTSHTPKAPHREWIEDMESPDVVERERVLFERTKEFDEYAFSRADFVIFPCREAEEPYFHTWADYPKFRDEKKILYLPTGCPTCVPKKTRAEIRTELGLSDERFVISFVGRHNEVKGYDRVIRIFEKLENVTVVCCGKEGAIRSPKSENWIEIGWTDDPFSYVRASDLFILPNRETYFDLALLETLSFGKTMLLSRTGGNKVFDGMEDRGIYLFDTEEDAVARIRELMQDGASGANESTDESADESTNDVALSGGEKTRKEKEAGQVLLHQEKYSMEKFCEGYKEILREILKK